MADKILLRGDTKVHWEDANPVLTAREVVIETDTLKLKVGDGTKTYTELLYVNDIDLSGYVLKDSIYNGLDKDVDGFVLDARKGLVLDERLSTAEEDILALSPKYRKWVGKISYDGGGVYSQVVLENELGITFTISNPSNGQVHLQASSNVFSDAKLYIQIGGIGGYFSWYNYLMPSLVMLGFEKYDGTTNSTPSLTKLPIEIRIYD